MRAFVNPGLRTSAVPAPSTDAIGFHATLPGYRPTPLRPLIEVAAELGLGAVALKDESNRLGLPAFKVLGASWAVERALRQRPGTRMLVAASAGNHGRAVARVAALRGLGCRIYLPAHSAAARREAIAAEGAEVVVTAGSYEGAVARATAAGREPGAIEIADVGESGPAHWVIDGYQTLFAEIEAEGGCDVLIVPVGVGSLAAAAARYGARAGVVIVGVEPAIDLDEQGRASFTLVTSQGSASVVLGFHGEHYVGNALAVAAVALAVGMPLGEVATALGEARPLSRWRMEVHERADGVTIVNDAYNANPDSMRAALKALAAMGHGRRTWAVLGEMLELGSESATEHEVLGRLAVRLGVSRVVAVGQGARPIEGGARDESSSGSGVDQSTWVPDTAAAYEILRQQLAPGDVVLVKSSRDAGLRWLGDRLLEDAASEVLS